MSDGPQSSVKFTYLDYVALGFILTGVEEFLRRGKDGWPVWVSGYALGLVVLSFRDRSPQLSAWFLRRFRRSKNVVPSVSLPVDPVPNALTKPQHNVQFVGFKFLPDPPLDVAGLYFQNVPIPGKLIGKFQYPRLRVVYYDHSTGQEIADMCPLQWVGSEYGPSEITAAGSYAEIAVFLTAANVWRLFEVDESSEYFKLHHFEVPPGRYRIIASLSGSYGVRIPPVEGILNLGEDGSASFEHIKVYPANQRL